MIDTLVYWIYFVAIGYCAVHVQWHINFNLWMVILAIRTEMS